MDNTSVPAEHRPAMFRSTIADITSDFRWSMSSKVADGLHVYAHALHSMISESCPEKFHRLHHHHRLGRCITGERLLDYMKKVRLDGYASHIVFDDVGDARGQFLVQQYIWMPGEGRKLNTIGRWNELTKQLTMNISLLDQTPALHPETESICSKLCHPGQYYQQRELACCWDCKECRSNEIIINEISCEQCPRFTWPDPETKTLCEMIPPYYLQIDEAMGLGVVCLSSLGIFIVASVVAIYGIKRKNRLLKATSGELSIIVLSGCFVACCVSILFVTYPNDIVCPLRQTGFHFAVSVTYSPLLVKTTRIYRIFNAGKTGTSRPKLISSRAQMMFTFVLIVLQMVLLVLLEVQIPSKPQLIMPFANERYVEITCSITMTSFIPPLSYNMAVIATCGVLGFLTRKLPENFNDSRYIFVSISTTFFMWVVILPT